MQKMTTLYIVCGLPFAGKSTLIKKLVEQFDFSLVASDEINKEIAMNQGTPSSSGENVEQLRVLTLRLLAHPFDAQPQLLAGSFPNPLPFDVPLPDGYQIIGSYTRTPEDTLLLFDTDQSPADIITFYTQRMQEAGWSEPDVLRRQRQHYEGGFTHTATRASYITLCKGRRGPALMISASSGQNEGERALDRCIYTASSAWDGAKVSYADKYQLG